MSKLEQLSEGLCALDYRGSSDLEGLRKVLKHCFPECLGIAYGFSEFYHQSDDNYSYWVSNFYNPKIKAYPLSDFLDELGGGHLKAENE